MFVRSHQKTEIRENKYYPIWITPEGPNLVTASAPEYQADGGCGLKIMLEIINEID